MGGGRRCRAMLCGFCRRGGRCRLIVVLFGAGVGGGVGVGLGCPFRSRP